MGNLGYTWYPKDFISDPDVMMMSSSERGVFRDLIDLAYMNDNKIYYSIDKLIKYCNSDEETILSVLGIKGKKINDYWTIPSCSKRIDLIKKNKSNGKRGGRPKKPKNNPDNNPKQNPNYNPDNNPKETQSKRQIEIEIEKKTKSKRETTMGVLNRKNIHIIDKIIEYLKKEKHYDVRNAGNGEIGFLDEIVKKINKKLLEENRPSTDKEIYEKFKLIVLASQWMDFFSMKSINSSFESIYSKSHNLNDGRYRPGQMKGMPW